MTPERWQRVDEIFQVAIELTTEERRAFVARACDGDEELRREVESLIQADKQGLSLVDEPALQVAVGLLTTSDPELAEGQSIGHYDIIELIGRGGMGEVYLAKDKLLHRPVALKLLPAAYTSNHDRLQRFEREAQAASALNHPNILTIYELGQVEGQHFIATELVEGETLRQRLKRAPLNFAETIEIAIQISSALIAAHTAGIIHRDIKPENVMLRPDGLVKVLDFGLAKLTEQHEPATRAQAAENVNISSGLVMGTVKYMSPEQARGLEVDQRSDIFSFGIMLYEMLAGRMPFAGENTSELIDAILKKEPPPLTLVPEAMQRLVSKALRKKKEERYPTIQDLLVDLKAVKEDNTVVGVAAQINDSVPSTRTAISSASSIEFFVSGIKRHKTGAVFVAASLALILLGVTFGPNWLTRTPRTDQMKITRIPMLDKSHEVAISPDGKYLAEIARYDDQSGIWLIEIATGNRTLVLAAPANILSNLIFAKDGEKIFYVSEQALYQIPVRGGAAAKVVADVESPLSLAPDEKQVAFVRKRNSDQESALTIMKVDGRGERVLATRQKPEVLNHPAWSPDGKLIVCSFGLNASNRTESLVAFDVATGREQQLTTERWQVFEQAVWLPDSSGLLAAAKEKGAAPTQIWQISYPAGEVRRITNDLDNYDELGLTADGNTLVAIQYAQRSSLWVVPKENPNGARPITANDRESYRAVSCTPDGKIVYPSDVSGTRDIWIMNLDGTNAKQLTANAGANILSNASPDGRYIVFASNRANKGAFNIWRMNMDGSNPLQLTHGSGESGPVCSPDGQWLVYSKGGPNVDNAQKTLWRVPIDGGAPVQLTNTPSYGAALSSDGTQIACWYKPEATAPWKLALLPFTGGAAIKFFDAPPLPVLWIRWTPDGQALSYIDTRAGVSNIWSQPLSGDPPRQVTHFTSEQISSFDWSRDGQLVCSRSHSTQDVVLITDFR